MIARMLGEVCAIHLGSAYAFRCIWLDLIQLLLLPCTLDSEPLIYTSFVGHIKVKKKEKKQGDWGVVDGAEDCVMRYS